MSIQTNITNAVDSLLPTHGVSSDTVGEIKEAEISAIVYRCQHLAQCDDPEHEHPCAHCKVFNYGRIAYTNNDDAQKTFAWRIESWVTSFAERVMRWLGGQSAVDEFRNQLALQKAKNQKEKK